MSETIRRTGEVKVEHRLVKEWGKSRRGSRGRVNGRRYSRNMIRAGVGAVVWA